MKPMIQKEVKKDNRVFAVFLSLVICYILLCCVTTTRERHDFVKSYIGDFDDDIVASGLISDEKLHNFCSNLGLCNQLEVNQ